MKPATIFALLLASAVTSGSALAAEKLCTGTEGEFRGYELRIFTSVKRLVVRPMPSNRGYIAFAGTYEANLLERRHPRGPLQLGFEGYEEGGFNRFFLDSTLLEPGTSGSLEVTNYDEGSLDAHFHCKDF